MGKRVVRDFHLSQEDLRPIPLLDILHLRARARFTFGLFERVALPNKRGREKARAHALSVCMGNLCLERVPTKSLDANLSVRGPAWCHSNVGFRSIK